MLSIESILFAHNIYNRLITFFCNPQNKLDEINIFYAIDDVKF